MEYNRLNIAPPQKSQDCSFHTVCCLEIGESWNSKQTQSKPIETKSHSLRLKCHGKRWKHLVSRKLGSWRKKTWRNTITLEKHCELCRFYPRWSDVNVACFFAKHAPNVKNTSWYTIPVSIFLYNDCLASDYAISEAVSRRSCYSYYSWCTLPKTLRTVRLNKCVWFGEGGLGTGSILYF